MSGKRAPGGQRKRPEEERTGEQSVICFLFGAFIGALCGTGAAGLLALQEDGEQGDEECKHLRAQRKWIVRQLWERGEKADYKHIGEAELIMELLTLICTDKEIKQDLYEIQDEEKK